MKKEQENSEVSTGKRNFRLRSVVSRGVFYAHK